MEENCTPHSRSLVSDLARAYILYNEAFIYYDFNIRVKSVKTHIENIKIGMTFGFYPLTIGFFGVINFDLGHSFGQGFLCLYHLRK